MIIQKTLNTLKRCLSEKGITNLIAGQGEIQTVSCSFNPRLEKENLSVFENKTTCTLPNDYKEFLLLHNGAKIFEQLLDGDINIGGGLHLFSLQEVEKFIGDLQYNFDYLYIGQVHESQLLISKNALKQRNPNYLYIAETTNPDPLNLNLELFVDRFIISQGANFWEWPYESAENYYKNREIDF